MIGDRIYSTEKSEPAMEENHGDGSSSDSKQAKKQYGGWKTMPYILGNEAFERLATLGLAANFMVYFMEKYHLTQVSASNFYTIWNGVSNFAPLIGAFISDSYAGKFLTIAFGSVACILGMATMTLTAWVPGLLPPKCDVANGPLGQVCKRPTKSQLGVLLVGLGMLSIGTGGIRPCSVAFGVEQFDATTEKGIRGINSFFNWYYAVLNLTLLTSQTVIVYIQDSVSWVLGFGIPTLFMASALIIFLMGSRLYVHVKPGGSIFLVIAQVFVAAYKKRHLKLPEPKVETDGLFYDPPLEDPSVPKLPLTNQLRIFNKAALIVDGELKLDGKLIKPWRVCSIQQVEDIKCVVKVMPIWIAGIINMTTMIPLYAFTVSQALKMDRHLGPKFKVPAGSMSAVQFLTVVIWVPIYDRFIVPPLRKITKCEGGISLLQRCGMGILFSILALGVAGIVEGKRRNLANLLPNPLGIAPMSFIWLFPQIILLGLCEAFLVIGYMEFLNKEFPHKMKSLANGLHSCILGFGSYLSSFIINMVHQNTGTRHHPDWLTNDLNAGRLDYLYYLLAGMGFVNFMFFLYCAHVYRYKAVTRSDIKSHQDLELATASV